MVINKAANFSRTGSDQHILHQRYPSVEQLIRLSVITQFFPPDYAATGQLIEELISQLGREGLDIKVFTGQPGYAFQSSDAPIYEKIGSVQIKRSRVSQLWPQRIRGKAVNGVLFVIRAALHIIKNCRRRNLLLITTAPPFLPILGYLAYLLFKIPYVCILYDLYPDIAVELGVVPGHHWLARFWRAVNRKVWRHAQQLIVLSPDMRQRITDYCPDVADKVAVIHSWTDPEWIVPLPKTENWFAMRYCLRDTFTVLYSGNMGRCHDMDTILQAAQSLAQEPIQFVCIGSGAKREGVMEKVAELGLENFAFLPYQDREVLPYSLTACDLSLVSMSEGMESLIAPSKLYPAMAAGRPIAVVCPPESYLHQLVNEAKCGAVFVNGDGEGLAQFIRSLMSDRPLAKRMGQAGRNYVQSHFTREVIANQYLAVLDHAFAKRPDVVEQVLIREK